MFIFKKIDLSNFITDSVEDMGYMFYGCSSLKELNLSNFETYNVVFMSYMFIGCSEELKKKIKSQNKNFKEIAFNYK